MKIEVYIHNRWQEAAEVKLLGDEREGTLARCLLEYNNDYAGKYLFKKGNFAVSLKHPVDFSLTDSPNWPSFLLDLMPSGAARRVWEHKLHLKNSKEHDWTLLNQGACNPIGNLRIAESKHHLQVDPNHPGFDLQDIIHKSESFLDYAIEKGAAVSGTTGAAGDAPKYLVSKSKIDKWHPSASIPQDQIESEWIVKFLRGRTKEDHLILESEAQCYQLASEIGLRTGFQPIYYPNTLCIPRFDVEYKGIETKRHGVESLYSAMGISEFGIPLSHEAVIRTIYKYCTHPQDEIVEYLLRDIFNYIIGNVDNHGRNTSFIKYDDETVKLSPIYDTAPMCFDPQLITRTIRWEEMTIKNETKVLLDEDELKGFLNSIKVPTEPFSQKLQIFLKNLSKVKTSEIFTYPEMLNLVNGKLKKVLDLYK